MEAGVQDRYQEGIMSEDEARSAADLPLAEPDEVGTVFASLRAKREAIGDPSRHIDLDVPGYSGELFIRYVPIAGSWDIMKKIGEKVNKSKNPRKELAAAADVLIEACGGIYIRTPKGRVLTLDGQPTEDETGEPIEGVEAPTFAHREKLAEALGFKIDSKTTARQCVFRTFNNDLAVQAQYIELSQWLQDRSKEDDDDFVGESEGSTR